MTKTEPVLRIKGLTVTYTMEGQELPAVDRVSFLIRAEQTVALVGESGCGKTTCALSILKLLPAPQARIRSGKILFKGQDLVSLSAKKMRGIRGNRISMIFQEPMVALNPVMRVGDQVLETVLAHQQIDPMEGKALAIDWLNKVGIPSPEKRARDYPHQLSGGMQQRVMMAMALILRPELLIADEPTTAVDVTVQAQLIDLLQNLKAQEKLAMLLITHDLSVVWETADWVCVMYAAEIVEQAPCAPLMRKPLHPYTKGLLNSLPSMHGPQTRLKGIPGQAPELDSFPMGCRFHNRCDAAMEICKKEAPKLQEVEKGRWAACHLYEKP